MIAGGIRASLGRILFSRPAAVCSIKHRNMSGIDPINEHIFTEEHLEMTGSLRKLIEREINPYVDQWERDQLFPAHTVIKKLGEGGFLGPTRAPEYGGLGLDYSYSIAIAEEMGSVKCGGVPMAIGVHTGWCELDKELYLSMN